MNLEAAGTKIGKIPVRINYRFLELFSEGLYSSPNKAFEELVSNSYDAYASHVGVYIPSDTTVSNAFMWVCDNGLSMDSEGLRELWHIASSHKRQGTRDSGERLQIGKFGIGKLATFSLCRKLTYICKKNGKYLAVTMDYGSIRKDADNMTQIDLDERQLTLQEVQNILTPFISVSLKPPLPFPLWGKESPKTWTFAIMTDLTPSSANISEGRLKWVLRTALPLNPQFNLLYNGIKLLSSKVDLKPIKNWIIGKDDKTADKMKLESKKNGAITFIDMPNIKGIHGKVELYGDIISTGKSERFGASNGFFIMVRNRLINLDDNLFGLPALSHGTFSRFRMIVHADELDAHLRSTREAILESPALHDLRLYLKNKFEEVRAYYNTELAKQLRESKATYKVARTAGSLSRRPLLTVAQRFLDGLIESLVLIDLPKTFDAEQKRDLLVRLEEDLTSEEGIIKEVEWEAMSPDDPIGKLDLGTGKVSVNLLHPFFANFMEDVKSPLPFQLLAISEILTEAYLIEAGMPQDSVRDIIWKRDELLRDLTLRDKPNAPLVATLLKSSLSDPSGLEDAVFNAFKSLGFETTKIGGNGKPDGEAVAILGVRNSATGRREDYKVVYDAKSTQKEKIKAMTAHISGVKRHKIDYNADFAVVIAIDFEGADDDASAVCKEATQNAVTLIRARDLMKLILIASPKQLGLTDLKDFFQNCFTPNQTSEWIGQAYLKAMPKAPIKEILETVYTLMKEDKEPPDLSSIRMSNKILKGYTKENLRSLIQSLERLIGGLISIRGETVSLEAPPARILSEIQRVSDEVPPEFLDMYIGAFHD